MLTDLRLALRRLVKSPGFSLAVVLTLGLTIGLSTTVFSVLDAVLFRPLPFSEPERIVDVSTTSPQGYLQPASYPEYQDWRNNVPGLAVFAGYTSFGSGNLERGTLVMPVHPVQSSDNFFGVFGVKPVLGRTFIPGEDRPGSNAVAVLSDEVWQSVFQRERSALGANITLNGRRLTVIGVMPPSFRYPINNTNAVYTPFALSKPQREHRDNHWMPTVARLAPGVSVATAQQQFNRLLTQLGRQYPDSQGRRAKLIDLSTSIGGKSVGTLRLLSLAVIAVLAIGCVNISGMLLGRGVQLEREMAVRSALGASRINLIRQVLAENVLFGIAGAVIGVLLAGGLLRLITALLVESLLRGAEVHINGLVAMEALLVALLCSTVAGLAPALRLSGSAALLALRSGGRSGADRQQQRLRTGFVAVQVALTMTLLFAAGLVFQALADLRHTSLGFDPQRILTAEVDLSAGNYLTKDVITNFFNPLLEKTKALPGVQAAGLIQLVPLQASGWNSDVELIGEPPPPPNQERLAEYRLVTSGYFHAFGVRLLRGRLLDDLIDNRASEPVTVVNQRFVDRFIPKGRDPIGMVVKDGHARIVGVVSNVRQDIREPALAEMDIPAGQIPHELRTAYLSTMQLVIRTAGDPKGVQNSLRGIYHQLDPGLPFREGVTMEEVVASALTFERLENWLFGGFGALAFLLAVVGIYGTVNHEVEMSTRNFGVRMALGAQHSNILSLVYRRVLTMLVPGLAAGLFFAWSARQAIRSSLSLQTHGELTVAVTGVAGFLAVAALAAAFPARSAARIDPAVALRNE